MNRRYTQRGDSISKGAVKKNKRKHVQKRRGSAVSKAALKQAAQTTLRQCLGVKKTESVLIITDRNASSVAHELFYEALRIARRVSMIEIPAGKVSGEEPPPYAAQGMKEFDIVICPTTKSLTHTNAVAAARKKGARVVTLPGITEEIFVRGMSADYVRIAERTEKVWSRIRKGGSVRVTTARGTDITMKAGIRVNVGKPEGFVLKKGESNNLPAGEAYLVPEQGSAQGVFVVDASMAGVGRLKRPITITVKNGYAVRIEGGEEAAVLRKALKPHGRNAYSIAELGIGTNDRARISGNILEDEKVLGTAHIALGNSKGMGGSTYAGCHLDGVFLKPTIYCDNLCIMKKGRLLV